MGATTHDMTTEGHIGVVTPLGNERDNILAFLDAVTDRLSPEDRVYCVLDNVSRDGTRQLVAARARADPRVVFVWSPQNRCVVDAYFAGYRAAYDAGCRWILEMDAGFSHPPEKIPEFIAAMEAGYEFVGGTRFAPGGAHEGPWTRRVLSYGGTVAARVLLRSRMTDMTSGFECFNRAAMEYVLERGVRSRANFFQTEIRHMMHRFRWTEIPFVYRNDQPNVGRSAIRESLRLLLTLSFENATRSNHHRRHHRAAPHRVHDHAR
jgi:dolichol-phosphate mannosyltransferase